MELLVAMTILVVVTGSTMLIFRGITRAWRSGQVRTERYQQARLLSDLFMRELSSSALDARYPFIGQAHTLCFTGTLPSRQGLTERSYVLNAHGQLLCREQQPPDGKDTTADVEEICGTDIQGFEVSYAPQADPLEWVPVWEGRSGGAQAGRLPKAVRILLTIGEAPSESFETIVYVPTS